MGFAKIVNRGGDGGGLGNDPSFLTGLLSPFLFLDALWDPKGKETKGKECSLGFRRRSWRRKIA